MNIVDTKCFNDEFWALSYAQCVMMAVIAAPFDVYSCEKGRL